jgi:outer membrane lipoprotein SlyB
MAKTITKHDDVSRPLCVLTPVQPAPVSSIGTAIGAIIGAIAGGGKGAAIAAVIDAAGGAGSVYVTGKDNLEFPTGTELTVRSGAPR